MHVYTAREGPGRGPLMAWMFSAWERGPWVRREKGVPRVREEKGAPDEGEKGVIQLVCLACITINEPHVSMVLTFTFSS